MDRRALLIGLGTLLSGCGGGRSQPGTPEAGQQIEQLALRALEDDRAWMRDPRPTESRPTVAANQTGDGYGVRVEYPLEYADDESAATVEEHANATAVLVFRALYGSEFTFSTVFVRAFVQLDPTPDDLQKTTLATPIHSVELSGETAEGVDWEAFAAADLPSTADFYQFDDEPFGAER